MTWVVSILSTLTIIQSRGNNSCVNINFRQDIKMTVNSQCNSNAKFKVRAICIQWIWVRKGELVINTLYKLYTRWNRKRLSEKEWQVPLSLKQITNFNTDKYIRDRPAERVTAITLSHSNRIPSMSLGERGKW